MENKARTLAAFALACVSVATAENNGLGITPPMGWNPYNHMKSSNFKWVPNEEIFKAQALALKSSGLQELGYTYMNLDAGWSLTARNNKTGRPQADPKLYPNIENGQLAKFLESEGFKFGIYSDSGTLHCGGGGPGGLNHEKVDAQAYADWGVSFLKYDNCNVPAAINDKPIPRYTAMSDALNATGRPIFFAMCEWGVANPAEWGAKVSNSWRTTADISDLWWAMCELADLTAEWFENAGPGAWNDPDLLEVGNGGMTDGEYRSQFAIWSLMKAPLLISTDVTNMSAATLQILSNKEIIAINQDKLGVAGRLVEERPPDPVHLQVWAGPLAGGKVAVVFWNRGNGTQQILGRFVDMQFDGPATGRDVGNQKDLPGVFNDQITMNVSSHDVAVVVLTPTKEDGTPLEGAEVLSDAAWAARWKGHGIKVPQSRLAWEAAKHVAHPV